MRACVDPDLCLGCGMCTAVAPDVFVMNDDGKAEVVADTTGANRDSIQEAAGGCPAEAITP